MKLADRPDCFVSEELTARFAGEPRAVHVLCLRDHSRGSRVAAGTRWRRRGLRRIPSRGRDRLRARPSVLQRRCAAHAATPPPSHRALPDLGGAQRVAGGGAEHRGAHGRHAGRVSAANEGSAVEAGGERGSAAKWAYAAIALATRALVLLASGAPYGPVGYKRRTGTVDPAAVLKIAQRTISEERRAKARSTHPRAPSAGGDRRRFRGCPRGKSPGRSRRSLRRDRPRYPIRTGHDLPRRREGEAGFAPGGGPRVALIADGIGFTHGLSATIEKIRELGVPGPGAFLGAGAGATCRRLPTRAWRRSRWRRAGPDPRCLRRLDGRGAAVR
jgi:hypothetical protein